MINQAPFLVVGIPLFSALLMGSFAVFFPSLVTIIGIAGVSLGGIASVILFQEVRQFGDITYEFGNWPAPIGIEYSVDHLNALMILLIYVVAFFSYIYSLKSVPLEIPKFKHGHITPYTFIITGLLALPLPAMRLSYVLFEICALSSYALLASVDHVTLATFYYLLIVMPVFIDWGGLFVY